MIREKSGTKIKDLVGNAIKLGQVEKCHIKKFLACLTEPSKGQCQIPGITYMLTCNLCQLKNLTCTYTGESSRSGAVRSLWHGEKYMSQDEDSVLSDHHSKVHEGQKYTLSNWSMKITGIFQKPGTRLAAEGIYISDQIKLRNERMKSSKSENYIILSSKKQLRQPGIIAYRPVKPFEDFYK